MLYSMYKSHVGPTRSYITTQKPKSYIFWIPYIETKEHTIIKVNKLKTMQPYVMCYVCIYIYI